MSAREIPKTKLTDSRERRYRQALTDFRDSDRWSPSINRIAKAALEHFYKGTENKCNLCGEPLNDMIHIATNWQNAPQPSHEP